MNLTLEELKEKLAEQHDPDTLIELLNLTSEEIVEAFTDKISDNYDKLIEEVEFDYGTI